MGALSSANLLRNTIPVEQARELVETMQSKKKLTTLCGLSGKETTLDFSNQGLGPGDAVLIANDISDMGTLSNGCTVDIQGLSKFPGLNGMKATVVQRIKMKDASMEAYEVEIVETGEQKKLKRANLAGGRVNNAALASLNLASNSLGAKGAKIIAAVLPKCT